MHIKRNATLQRVLSEYSRMASVFYNNKKWECMSENELWLELCLCILSSNVPYELAESAFFHLMKKGYLLREWIVKKPNCEKVIAGELSRQTFLPKKLDGSYRKYRFPNSRSRDICRAAKLVSTDSRWLSNVLESRNSEEEARDILVNEIPGIGLKQASHFLRNIRYSSQLAIVDSHVLSFLVEIGAVAKENAKITSKTYLELESLLQAMCNEYGLNLSILDMAIWNCVRREK